MSAGDARATRRRLVHGSAGPGQRGTVGLRRIAGREDERRGVLEVALGAQALDRARQRELGAAQALDEVAATADPPIVSSLAKES